MSNNFNVSKEKRRNWRKNNLLKNKGLCGFGMTGVEKELNFLRAIVFFLKKERGNK